MPGAAARARDSFWLQGMLAGHKAVMDCIKAFSETDFTEELKKFNVPTLPSFRRSTHDGDRDGYAGRRDGESADTDAH